MKYGLFAFVIALLAGASLWWVISQGPGSVPESKSEQAAPQRSGIPEQAPVAAATASEIDDSDAVSSDAAASTLLGPIENKPKPAALASAEEAPTGPEVGEANSGLTPVTVLENLRAVFRQYHLRFGANPVGDNAEITASLNGKNSRQTIFVSSDDGLRTNDRGELVDNWGTPFFFHQLSRTEMEIHSAGPDRKMWSQDDLVLK